MQYSYILTLNKIRKSRTFSLVIKSAVFSIVSVYLIYTIWKKDFNISFKEAFLKAFETHTFLLIFSSLLFIANWALEAWKWQNLGSKLEKLSFAKSLRGVLAGVTLSFVTPLGLGDYAGRIWTLTNTERSRSVGAVFLCRMLQLYVTLMCGVFSLLVYSYSYLEHYWVIIIITMFLILNYVLGNYKRIIAYIGRSSFFKRFFPYISIIGEYTYNQVGIVLFISILRYLVFTVQFILLLEIFGVMAPSEILLAGIFFVFVVRSVVPTMFDLGVRESAAILIFSAYAPSENILYASLSLWVINLLIPAIIGMFLIFRLKLFPQA